MERKADLLSVRRGVGWVMMVPAVMVVPATVMMTSVAGVVVPCILRSSGWR